MVDVYHLFKLGTTALRVVKASKGAYDVAVIFKTIWKPMAAMGACGIIDGACEDLADIAIEKIVEEKKNGCSR